MPYNYFRNFKLKNLIHQYIKIFSLKLIEYVCEWVCMCVCVCVPVCVIICSEMLINIAKWPFYDDQFISNRIENVYD
jgi:small-conductance mechanosensitive channel